MDLPVNPASDRPAAAIRAALAAIEARLHEAIRTLAALPDRERAWLREPRAYWPAPLRDFWHEWSNAVARGGFETMRARAPAPTPEAIDRMLPTLSWLAWLDARERKIIWLRAFGVSWWQIGGRFDRSEKTVQRWNERALERVHARLVMAA